MIEERYLTVAQIAERLQVAPGTVRHWLRTGELQGIALGPKAGYRVTETQLKEFLERRKPAA
jgi:excisionase family DNA binding protein